jgi:hypothetical protein
MSGKLESAQAALATFGMPIRSAVESDIIDKLLLLIIALQDVTAGTYAFPLPSRHGSPSKGRAVPVTSTFWNVALFGTTGRHDAPALPDTTRTTPGADRPNHGASQLWARLAATQRCVASLCSTHSPCQPHVPPCPRLAQALPEPIQEPGMNALPPKQ